MMSSLSKAPSGEPNSQLIQKFKFTTEWVENHSTQWPLPAETLLRKCMKEWGILIYDATSTEYALRLQNIAWKLSLFVDRSGWDNKKHNSLFLLQIDRKIGQIRNQTQQQQTHDALQKLTTDRQKTSRPPVPLFHAMSLGSVQSSPPNTPPTHESTPTKHEQAMKTWNTFDSELQCKTFRAQLRYAKSPKALMSEMATFWHEHYNDSAGSPSNVSKISPATQAWTYLASLAEKAQVSLDNVITPSPVDCSDSKSRCPAGETMSQRCDGKVYSTAAQLTTEDNRVTADCQTRLTQKPKNKNKEQASAHAESPSREETTSRTGLYTPKESGLSRNEISQSKQNILAVQPKEEDNSMMMMMVKQERDTSSPPRLDLGTIMVEERVEAVQLKRAPNEESDKDMHAHKRIKLEA